MSRLVSYRYSVGSAVQLLGAGNTSRAYMVTWRGPGWQQWPDGRWHRVATYGLSSGGWDCYYEEELVSAWRGLG